MHTGQILPDFLPIVQGPRGVGAPRGGFRPLACQNRRHSRAASDSFQENCREPPSSHAELAQVVIEVFVHAAAPFLWSERTKEGMRMAGTLLFSALVELPQF
jgi:hypothetical protein